MTRVDLLFRLAVFCLSLSFFKLDNVKTKFALDHITDLSRLQGVGSLLEFGDHVAVTEPTEIAAFVFSAVAGKLLRQFGEVFSGASTLENFLSFLKILFV